MTSNRSYQFYSWIVRTYFASQMIWNNGKNDCRSAKLYFQVMFSLSLTSSSLKLPNVSVNKSFCRMENSVDCIPREPACKDGRWCRGNLDAQIFISHELNVMNQV